MINSSKIRTMKDDLDDATNMDSEKKSEEPKDGKSPIENIEKSTPNKQVAKCNSSVIEGAISKNKIENISHKDDNDKKKSTILDSSVVQGDDELNNTQDDQLASLIKIANSERDKDSEDEAQSVIDKNSIILSQNTEIENKKNDSIRRIIEDQNDKETNIKGNNIDDLKNLISRISKPSISSKDGSITDDAKNEKVVSKENDNINVLEKTEIIPEKTEPIAVVSVETVKDNIHLNKEKIINKPKDINKVSQSNLNDTKQTITPVSPEKNVTGKEDVVDKKENHKKFKWKDFSKKINVKTSDNKIDKIDDIKKEAVAEGKKNDEINILSSGLLNVKKDKQKEDDPQFVKKGLLSKYNETYISPSERLIHGKQEMYSSVSKIIKQKNDNDDIASLKESERIKNEQANVISKDEEYKKLKKGIIQKYHIKLSALPWKKIIPIGLIFVILVGAVAWIFRPKIQIEFPVEPPLVVIECDIERFLGIEEITRVKNSIIGLYNPNGDDEIEFDKDTKVLKFKIVDSDNNDSMLNLEDALDTILRKDRSYFYDGFFEEITGNYNIFMFKTEKGTIRYGLAIETKEDGSMYNVMKRWEADGTNNMKMIAVFKNLFIDDASGAHLYKAFTSIDFNGIEINYSHLKDKNTALNYFIHDNILVITTSIDSNSIMVDLVTEN